MKRSYRIILRIILSVVVAFIFLVLFYLLCSLFSWTFNFTEWNLFSNIIKWLAVVIIALNFVCATISTLMTKNQVIGSSMSAYDKKMIRQYYSMVASKLSHSVKCAMVFQFSKSIKLLKDNRCDYSLVDDLRTTIAKGLGVTVHAAELMFYTELDTGLDKDLELLTDIRRDRNLQETFFVHLHMMLCAADGQGSDDLSDVRDLVYQSLAEKLLKKQCKALGLTLEDAQIILKRAYNC